MWDAFVESHPDGTFFHLAGWRRIIEDAFGHETHYLFAEQDDRIIGVLPLARVKSRLFGDHLISTPFCVYGGPVAVGEAVETALIEHACKLAESLGVDDLELRSLRQVPSGWAEKHLYCTFRKAICGDAEANMKAIPRKQRAMVRKGIEAGLTGGPDPGVDRLYRVYAESVRNLGTPVFSKSYFKLLREVFQDRCDVLMITHGGADVAGVLSFYFRDEVLPYYGGSRPPARALKANDFMYWDLMCRAAEKGCRLFDFGRSKRGTGPFSFKRNWGFEAQPLHYAYFLVGADEMPQVDPTNPKYSLMIEAWKKLPLPVANTIGPMLARNLG